MAERKTERATDGVIVARNFIARLGKAKFRRFIKLLSENVSGEVIAREFGVSRERVRQWKNAFGSVVQTYVVSPQVKRLTR
ncbi:hypothetical protein EDM80_06185 [bacterium]|nr:MAG: hypothetical protein EDM80_06185 [bacterium]RIK61748.1 MAG: hypothetical protein DCC64_12550 [Planctomycetota bacterium]